MKIKVITSEITQNKVFYENEMLKKILSDCTAYYTVILLKRCYYRNCLVLTFVSNVVLLPSRHTSIHGVLFGVRALRVMTRENLEEKLQLLFILVRLQLCCWMRATPCSAWLLMTTICCTKAAAVWMSSSSSQVAGSSLRMPSCKPSFWNIKQVNYLIWTDIKLESQHYSVMTISSD